MWKMGDNVSITGVKNINKNLLLIVQLLSQVLIIAYFGYFFRGTAVIGRPSKSDRPIKAVARKKYTQFAMMKIQLYEAMRLSPSRRSNDCDQLVATTETDGFESPLKDCQLPIFCMPPYFSGRHRFFPRCNFFEQQCNDKQITCILILLTC